MVELAGLHVKLTGDAASLNTATSSALAGFAKLGFAAKKIETSAAKSSSAAVRQAAAFRKVAVSSKLAASAINQNSAVLKAFAAAATTSQSSVASLNTAVGATSGNMAAAGVATNRLTGDIRTSRFHTANLTAQFNDIGVMLNSGQSPFTLAIQQGTQITQVLQTMGGTAKQQVGALITAFKAMVSPTAIAVVGIIALGVVLARWGLRSLGAAKDSDVLKKAIEALDGIASDAKKSLDILTLDTEELAEEFGKAGLQARLLARDLARLGEAQLTQALEKKLTGLSEQLGGSFGNTLALELQKAIVTGARELDTRELRQAFVESVNPILTSLVSSTATFTDQEAAIIKLIAVYDRFDVSLTTLPPDVIATIVEFDNLSIAALRAARAVELALSIDPNTPVRSGKKSDSGTTTQDEMEELVEQIRERAEINALANEEEFIRLQESFFNRLEAEQLFHDDRMSIIKAFEIEREENEQAAEALREQEVQRHNDRIAQIEREVGNQRLKMTAGLIGGMADILAQGSEKMMQIAKVFGAAEALVNAWIAFSQVLRDPTLPWWAKIPAALTVLTSGIAAVNAIKSVGKGGTGITSSSGGKSQPTNAGQVQTQEASNTTTVNIGLRGQTFDRGAVIGLIEQINEAVGDGARIRVA